MRRCLASSTRADGHQTASAASYENKIWLHRFAVRLPVAADAIRFGVSGEWRRRPRQSAVLAASAGLTHDAHLIGTSG